MTVRAVFFDAGNTLLWLDYAAIVRAVEGRVDEREIARADAVTRRALDAWMLPEIEAGRFPSQESWMGGRSLADVLLDALPIDASLRDRARGVLAELDRTFELWTVVPPQAVPTLDLLRRRGLKLAVVSNADGRIAWKFRQVGLAGYFETIVDSGIEGVGKPSPEIFHRAMTRVGVAPSESVFVGDIYSVDVVGARHAGMQAILFDRTGLYGGFDCLRSGELRELERLI